FAAGLHLPDGYCVNPVDRLALKAADTINGGVFITNFRRASQVAHGLNHHQPVNSAYNLTVEGLSENGSELSILNKSKKTACLSNSPSE
ncbi:hypothetical protein IHY38_004788, partial [Salmonella enterica]|nr:hypothetical protein [Salmonella enterica]